MKRDAGSLRCPQCGAATRSGAPRCQYCRARLATVSCPQCFTMMFAEAGFCPKCGERRERRQGPADARCPGCREPMASLQLGPTSMLECDTCDGLWMEAETFERLCADREAQAAVLHLGPLRGGSPDHRVTYRPCITCGTMMNRVNFARVSGIIVDVCRAHGTFLDAGELHAIVAFIQDGGLERSRERQIQELRDAERRLRTQEARLAAVRYERRGSVFDRRTGFGDLIAFMAGDS